MVSGRTIHSDARLNVLLTLDRPHASEHWTNQLSRLLEPQGVAAYVVDSVQEAMEVATELPIHAAVVDLGTPLEDRRVVREGEAGPTAGPTTGGARSTRSQASGELPEVWVLELFQRLPRRLPVVVVHSPARSRRENEWILSQTLRLGAFSVLNKPVQLEQLLIVFQRLVDRRYRGNWPDNPPR